MHPILYKRLAFLQEFGERIVWKSEVFSYSEVEVVIVREIVSGVYQSLFLVW